jgi:prefoldin subunit 5
LSDFSAFKKMRDATKLLRERLKSLDEKNTELEKEIAAPRAKMIDAKLRCF